MTILKKTLSLAAVLAAGVSTAALAQDTDASGGVGAGVGVNAEVGEDGLSVGADTGVDGGVSANSDAAGGAANVDGDAGSTLDASNDGAPGTDNWTYGRVISSIQTGAMADVDYDSITADTMIDVVTLSELEGEGAENSGALDAELSAMADAQTEMRDGIAANADLTAALEAEGHTSDDVVAIWSNADGSYNVLVDDRG
ncbi:hypothetical protein [Maritimibacter sp. DP1N21-5]|uniref:hypothetical protein n=1 Tax=Maritimibacter sp. DP1N21-5 TaxID=2836867 RepID=UPI001C482706|nr:hypothetical protein [Maritimibacter sp. DP1N21-5]MBV7409273.1 hypothetical protein [Maritimibacter sp. DP1N21-5]